MKFKFRFVPVAVALVAVLASPPLLAQKSKPKPPSPGYAYASATPIAQGSVTRFVVNPFGEVDGLLLDNGTLVTFPPHMMNELTAAIAPGDTVAVKGFQEGPAQIKGLVLTNVRSNQSVMEHPPADFGRKLPPHLRAVGLKEMNADGVIRYLKLGRRGEIKAIVLEDGSTVRLPREAAWQMASTLQIGQAITVTGYGTVSQFGRGIEATAIGPRGQTPQPLYDVGVRR